MRHFYPSRRRFRAVAPLLWLCAIGALAQQLFENDSVLMTSLSKFYTNTLTNRITSTNKGNKKILLINDR